ncbi:THAP domain-containing protein 10-like isoform X1 [Notothenia coriiceps]|uniref:THAP domain-containing protein 1 n=1 Tax=Notothenia coriiceps TaxID=8208 RepID=A0A6I9Q3M0_9TELE|nr:PREDICTED: THAP domain-containing protein 10-like isoform X1 [Notothenia coriiceps]
MFLRTLTTMSSKGVKRCVVVGCNNLNKGKVLHALPSLEKYRNLWLEFIFQGHVPEDYNRFLLVCSEHFAPDMFMNFAQVKEGFASRLRLKPGSIPTIRDQASEARSNVEAGTGDSFCQTSPAVRHVASQTDPPEIISDTQLSIKTEPLTRRSVGTQLSKRTLQNPVRSTATQARVPGKDCGVCTPTFPLDSPLLLLQPTMVKRPPKRPRLSLSDEEEGPSEGCSSMGINEPGNST